MEQPAGRRLLEEAPSPVRDTHRLPDVNDDSLALTGVKHAEADKHIDKRSLDYIVRSGTAGGLAGCAVSRKSFMFELGIWS